MILNGIFGKSLLNWTIVLQIKTRHHYRLSLSLHFYLSAYDVNTQTYVLVYTFARKAYLLKPISDRKSVRNNTTNHLEDT